MSDVTSETLDWKRMYVRAQEDFNAERRINVALRAQLAASQAQVVVGNRMHDFLCRLFGSPNFLADAFSKECWTLMQDWTAPAALAAGKEERRG